MDKKNLYNGRFANCPKFQEFLDRFRKAGGILPDDGWWVRDYLADAWNAGVDAALDINLTRDQRAERANFIDRFMERPEDLKK